MLEVIASIMGSTGLGAVVGLIGSAFTKYLELKTLKERLAFEKSMAEIRTKELELEQAHAILVAEKKLELTQAEGEIQREVAEIGAFLESQRADAVRYGGWVDQVRGLMRPVITIFLLTLVTVFMWRVWQKVGGLEALDQKTIIALFDHMIRSVIFLTVTAVAWWFGSRATDWATMRKAA